MFRFLRCIYGRLQCSQRSRAFATPRNLGHGMYGTGEFFYQQLYGGRHRIHKGRAEGHPMPIPDTKQTQMHVRLALPNGASIDEDDIILIETIQHCRSILGTSKLLGLSCRTAWLMSDALNRMFECKVIGLSLGGMLLRRLLSSGNGLSPYSAPSNGNRPPRPLKRSTSLQLLLTGRTASRTPRGRLYINPQFAA